MIWNGYQSCLVTIWSAVSTRGGYGKVLLWVTGGFYTPITRKSRPIELTKKVARGQPEERQIWLINVVYYPTSTLAHRDGFWKILFFSASLVASLVDEQSIITAWVFYNEEVWNTFLWSHCCKSFPPLLSSVFLSNLCEPEYVPAFVPVVPMWR